MAALGLVFIGVLFIGIVPLCLCAMLARVDAHARQRRFGQRIFYTASFSAVLFGGLVLCIFYFYVLQQPRPTNTGVAISWASLLLACGFVFLLTAFTGSIGYAVSYRLFDRTSLVPPDQEIDPNTRGEETGNPYQPPPI
jgi:hypothetical protein